MPIPHIVAKANRFVANPIARRFAGKMPPFILIRHVGRTSGKTYQTPVMAFTIPNGFLFALTYGPRTDWLRNFQATGSCEAIYRNRVHLLTKPRLVHGPPGDQPLPRIVQFALAILGVNDFLLADASTNLQETHRGIQ